jgi:sRNA-binding carbon storage regulator CsrA
MSTGRLVTTVRRGETISFSDGISIKIVKSSSNVVRLQISAPKKIKIRIGEADHGFLKDEAIGGLNPPDAAKPNE